MTGARFCVYTLNENIADPGPVKTDLVCRVMELIAYRDDKDFAMFFVSVCCLNIKVPKSQVRFLLVKYV